MFSRIRGYLDHRVVARNLSAYMDNALAAPERERVERHLAVCALCQRELATLRQTVSLLRRVPLKRVPRSFALPASVQAEREAYRRWGLANSFLRASAVAVTFMLILFLSTEALFRFGAIPISGTLPAPAEYAVQSTREVEAVPEAVTAQAPSPLEPTAEVETPVREPPAEQPTASPGVSPLEMNRDGGAAGGAPEQEVVVEKKALPAPPEAPAEGTFSAETKMAVASQAAESPPETEAAPSVGATVAESATGIVSAARPQEMAPSPTMTSTWTPAPSETPTATPTPTASATPQPTATATVTPRPTATPIPTEPAPLVTAEPAEPAATVASPLWRLWGTVRLLSGLLVGLLFILFAGLLWTSRKWRV